MSVAKYFNYSRKGQGKAKLFSLLLCCFIADMSEGWIFLIFQMY